MYTCNNRRGGACCEHGTLSPKTGPAGARSARTRAATDELSAARSGQASESDNQTEQHDVQVALATCPAVADVERALILQPQIVDIEEAPADSEAGVPVGRTVGIRDGEAAKRRQELLTFRINPNRDLVVREQHSGTREQLPIARQRQHAQRRERVSRDL